MGNGTRSYTLGHKYFNTISKAFFRSRTVFLGKHTFVLKNKNRMIVPAEFGGLIAGGVYVTQGFDRNLLALTSAAFREIYQRMIALNLADPAARLMGRVFLGSAGFAKMDKSGAIDLPDSLIQYAKIEDRVVAVGQGTYFEIWSPVFWERQQSEIENSEANAERFTSLMLGQ
jgi:MraZ protein